MTVVERLEQQDTRPQVGDVLRMPDGWKCVVIGSCAQSCELRSRSVFSSVLLDMPYLQNAEYLKVVEK